MATEASPAAEAWSSLNRRYLELELKRLRLRLRRKVLWLRTVWEEDPLEGYQGMVVSETRADQALAGRDEEGEAAFYRENDDAQAMGRQLQEVREALAQQKNEMREAGVVPALDLLVRTFGLTSFERDVLVLCLAPELDASFQKLYAYVQDDPSKTYATPHLARTLLAAPTPRGEDERSVRDGEGSHFLFRSPLRRFRLVRVDDGGTEVVRASRPLRLDERVTAYLQGENRLPPALDDLLRPVEPAPVSAAHEKLVNRLAPTLTSELEEGVRPAVNLVGSAGAGTEAVAQVLSNELSLELRRINVQRLPAADTDRRDVLRLLEREAVLLQGAYYVDATAFDDPTDETSRRLDAVIENLDATLFVASRSRREARRDLYTAEVPKPDAAAQKALWSEVLGESSPRLNGRLTEIVQQFDFGPGRIVDAAAAASRRVQFRNSGGPLQADDLWRACRKQADAEMDDLAREITPDYTWDDIVLPDDTFDQLQEIAGQVAEQAQVYHEWGFEDRLSRGLGISALFAGPSGTGKTMAAEILANELDLALYRIDLAGMVSKYIGETEKNLRKVFDAAERSGAILFFDEADALFGERTEVSDSHDRYANIEIDYLLQRMEAYRGLAVLATNRKGDLDWAFLRRLRFIVDFPRPDAERRRAIWEKAFPDDTPLGELDYGFLSRLDVTGANIQNTALNAAFLAAEVDSRIEMQHVMHAARREYEKIGKLVTESEFGSYYDQP
jgi:AAA+ superfamily predicted ATPase